MRLAGLDCTELTLAHNRDAVGEPGIEPADRLHISAIAGQNRCELCGHREDRIRDPHDIVSQLGWIAGERPALSVLDEDAASDGLDAMAVTAPPARPFRRQVAQRCRHQDG